MMSTKEYALDITLYADKTKALQQILRNILDKYLLRIQYED